MESSIELLARRKVLAFGIDAFIVVNIVLVTYGGRCMNEIISYCHR
jgi:hypothetical protein